MSKIKNEELLKNAEVQEEISRHRWIESEKAGTDIGFDKAAAQWLNAYSDAWLAQRKPAAAKVEIKAAAPKRDAKKVSKK